MPLTERSLTRRTAGLGLLRSPCRAGRRGEERTHGRKGRAGFSEGEGDANQRERRRQGVGMNAVRLGCRGNCKALELRSEGPSSRGMAGART